MVVSWIQWVSIIINLDIYTVKVIDEQNTYNIHDIVHIHRIIINMIDNTIMQSTLRPPV